MLDAFPVPVRLSAGLLIAFPSLTFQPIMGRVMLLRTQNSGKSTTPPSLEEKATDLDIQTPPPRLTSLLFSWSFRFSHPSSPSHAPLSPAPPPCQHCPPSFPICCAD